MKRKPNADAGAQRIVAERYGVAQRSNLYKRLRLGKPFALFLVDARLSITTYPSPQHTWLQIDCPANLAGVYIDMPDWQRILHDLEATEASLKAAPKGIAA